ncbi:MAG: hypothetical protein U9Q69_03645, partial [Nanoarchaeota archaeon]|nr:hypothetical protein [Nanoarchaeota archaeon]
EEKELRLFPLQQRTETFSFSIDAGALPKDYDLSIRVVYNDEILKQAVSKFQVLENTDVKQKKEFESGFLTKTYSITKTNYGNTIVEEAYTLKLTYFQKLFASYNENPSLIDEQGLHWHYAVNPDSTYTITATVNYRPLFIAFFIVIVFIILVYLWLSRGVSIKKEIIKVRETSEGITEVKILLHLKNKSSRTIRFLKIVEILPTVLEPIKDFGTLKPEKIQKGRKGVRLMWVIPELVKGEERIISYKAKSKINIIGTFLLLPAKIRYKNIGGKAITINSNRPSFTVTTAQEN